MNLLTFSSQFVFSLPQRSFLQRFTSLARTFVVGVLLCLFFSLVQAQQPASGATQDTNAAGKVLMAIGETKVTRQGQTSALTKGATVEAGDLVTTGVASNLQLRMIDGAVLALRAQTEFKIDQYKFNGKEDGSEKAVLSLVKGGVRAVTGAIGHQNQDNLQVNAVVATVGIRGTGFNLTYCQNDCLNTDKTIAKEGLYAGVFEGKITLKNQAASDVLGVNQYYYVADQNTAPKKLLQPPNFLPDPLAGKKAASRKSTNASIPTLASVVTPPAQPAADTKVSPPTTSLPNVGQIVVTVPDAVASNGGTTPLVPTNLYNLPSIGDGKAPSSAASYAFYMQKAETWPGGPIGPDGLAPHNSSADSNPPAGPLAPNGISVTTGGSGTTAYVTKMSLNSPPYVVVGTTLPVTYSIGTAQQMEGGNFNGIISWGRWANGDVQQIAGYNQGQSFYLPADSGFHYIVGDLTSPANMSLLSANHSVLTFALLGATTPTAIATTPGTWVVTGGTLTANFASPSISGNLGLYATQAAGSGTYNMAFSGGLSPSASSHTVNTTVTKVSGTLGTCSGSCNGNGNVSFYGNATPAQAAGLSYNFSTGTNLMQGVAVFKR